MLFLQKKNRMKKLATFTLVLFVIALTFSACKSKQDCPAYSQAETEISVRA